MSSPDIFGRIEARVLERAKANKGCQAFSDPLSGLIMSLNEFRQWSVERHQALVARVRKEYNFDLVVTGEPRSLPDLHPDKLPPPETPLELKACDIRLHFWYTGVKTP